MIDSAHLLDELLGFWNVPMAVWIDEDGVLVRPPEGASVEESTLRTMDISGLPDGVREIMEEVKKIPGDARRIAPRSSTGPTTAARAVTR